MKIAISRKIKIGGAVCASDTKLKKDSIEFGRMNKAYRWLTLTNAASEREDLFAPFVSKDGKNWRIAFAAVSEDGTLIDLRRAIDELGEAVRNGMFERKRSENGET